MASRRGLVSGLVNSDMSLHTSPALPSRQAESDQSPMDKASDRALNAMTELDSIIGRLAERLEPVSSQADRALIQAAPHAENDEALSYVTRRFAALERMAINATHRIQAMLEALDC